MSFGAADLLVRSFFPRTADAFEAARLPHGLEETRHILDLERIAWSAAAVLALLLLALLLRWLRRRKPKPPPRDAPPRTVPPAPAPTDEDASLADTIRDLHRRHLEAGSFRAGCHELASLLRTHYEGVRGARYTRLTVGEIIVKERVRQRSDTDGGLVGQLFSLLQDLQFGRDEPVADDLDGACRIAVEVTTGKKRKWVHREKDRRNRGSR